MTAVIGLLLLSAGTGFALGTSFTWFAILTIFCCAPRSEPSRHLHRGLWPGAYGPSLYAHAVPLLISSMALAVLSAAALQIAGLDAIWGIAFIIASVSLNQLAYVLGAVFINRAWEEAGEHDATEGRRPAVFTLISWRDRQRVENLAPTGSNAKRGEQVSAITARSARDRDRLAMQDLDRLAKFKRRTVDPDAIWVCEQLESAWSALPGAYRTL